VKIWLYKSLKRIRKSLAELAAKVDFIIEQGAKIMAVVDDLKKSIADLDAATNEVAAEVAKLASQIPPPGNVVSETDAANLKAGFQGIVDRLTVLGKDPNQPVPPAPPTPTTGLAPSPQGTTHAGTAPGGKKARP
jgi:hypothetical protein